MLLYYVEEKAPETTHPELIGYHMLPLNQFFGSMMCSEIDGKACRDYVKGREAGRVGRRAVKAATAGRELETLQAALNFAYDEKKLLYPIKVKKPKKSPARVRWLTDMEVARLLRAALGFVPTYCDVATRRHMGWRRPHAPQYHVARFILIGLYTGTRHDAILNLRWSRNDDGGWFDLAHGVMYRRGEGEAETNKRRPPVPIGEDLMLHLPRWRRRTQNGPVQYRGELIAKMKTGFNNARDRAGLGRDVVPHVLRHTCATWLLMEGESIWDVAGWLGTTEKVIRDTYGHHSTEHLKGLKRRFRGRKLGETENGKGQP
ncbi:tyrosine-type recombinase/integrase [Rhizobium sp. LjRoot254]|uniref:tyrosine-type recombinase/integrase n=1 Tax=Rhizobium sp. LjRoot254 TaxID=3342297 RepID=UPI003ECEF9E4